MKYILGLFLLINLCYTHSFAAIPATIDSRIKTYVFSENEVFRVVVHYGFQSNIEFAEDEEIQTLFLGNYFSWKITPVGRRLFIKALEGAAKTNMTIVTNKRTYQFELESKDPGNYIDDELVYVVRFYYPDKNFDIPKPNLSSRKFALNQKDNKVAKLEKDNFNFNYSLTGTDKIAPLKVFDDGSFTYIKFANNNSVIPQIYEVNNVGQENRLSYSIKDEYVVIKQIPQKLALKLGQDIVTVYNDSYN